MKIFVLTETLLAGGAEWFALRLCSALQEQGHEVRLFVMRPDLIDKRVAAQFPHLDIIHPSVQTVGFCVQADRVLNKLTGAPRLFERMSSRFLSKHINRFQPDVLHSHLLNVDMITIAANRYAGKRHICTIHGDYIQAVKNGDKRSCDRATRAIQAIDQVVAISDEQTTILNSSFPEIRTKLCKIYNGYPAPAPGSGRSDGKLFKFGMIARGIPEKGWEPAIQAFTRLTAPQARLILYGESAYLNELKQKYTDSRIIFAGFSSNPIEAVSDLDAGLLPSYYDAESLPTTIIEYLAAGKPVIATTVGEVPAMLRTRDGQYAGILIGELDPTLMAMPLSEAMNEMMNNTELYDSLAGRCGDAFSKFSMDKCVTAYIKLYKSTKMKEACAVS